ncbi:universal stress protein [Denitrobaculum tricleocarpae]|uniref:Universal stress protein n=1 Tax=Denitrobaculum tricleocarpae TaxID=2591009 RepID=A0A545TMP5_9PROT|nr:universal stress protein [Denitrobaculum tricleocarpae]TQV78500.1 universal stress protein [Denitrobaculum tricleocarpae]
MKRFTNILLVCDEDSLHDALIERAVWLAKANGARITLVDVMESAPGELASLFGSFSGAGAQDVEHEVIEFRSARLADIAGPIKSEGIQTAEVVLQGNPFIEIIRKVLRDEHDLVMKGAAGASEGRSLFFASTDMHVLRKCPCPVWIMKNSPDRRNARILAAVDPDPANEQKVGLNTLVMELATSLTEIDESELHIMNTWRLEEEAALRNSAFAKVPKARIDKLVDEQEQKCQQNLSQLLFRYPDTSGKHEVHLEKGAAREIIPEFAEQNKVDLIVMGTVGRTGVSGLIIGNTAEAILNQVECSVLAVKPPGFETPVKLH